MSMLHASMFYYLVARLNLQRGFKLSIKYINNGKERDYDEWAALIARVDIRLRLRGVTSPPGSMLSVTELELVS